MSVDAIVARVAGQTSALLLTDATGEEYRLVPSNGTLVTTKNGVAVVPPAPVRTILTKTADYTVSLDDSGTVFSTKGSDDTVAFTLPAAEGNAGAYFEFINASTEDLEIEGPTDSLLTPNAGAVTSFAFSDYSAEPMSTATVVSDGEVWLVTMNIYIAPTPPE